VNFTVNHQCKRNLQWQTASLAVAALVVTGWLFPPICLANEPVPVIVDWTHPTPSAIDFTPFIDRPAGKGGHLKVRGSRFVDATGKRVRFWGVNIALGATFPDKAMAPILADDLARMGVNIVRFHHLDVNWGGALLKDGTETTQELDAERLDRLDFFIYELKERGIYIDLGLNVMRFYKAGDEVRDHAVLGMGKAAVYFNPRLIELQKLYATQLLTHKNPYTHNEYRDEPALAIVEVLNENSIIEAWWTGRLVGRDDKGGDTWSPLPVSYAEELTTLFNDWLPTVCTPEELAGFRAEQKVADDSPIPRLANDQFWSVSRERFFVEARFLMHIESQFFKKMIKFLKEELGLKSLTVGSADHNDWITGYPHQTGLSLFDVLDGHGYWEHPEIGTKTKSKNTPMVNDPLDSTVVQFARSAMQGKPFTISEVNHPFPHEFACEGYPILTAYALLQDWDGINWFDWEYGRLKPAGVGVQPYGWFDISNDPVKLACLVSSALMWHRGDVKSARATFSRSLNSEQIAETLLMNNGQQRPYFMPGFPKSLPLRQRSNWVIGPSTTTEFPPEVDNSDLRSDTGQLRWRHQPNTGTRQNGLVTINTPKTQAAIGFVSSAPVELDHLKLELSNQFASIMLNAVDDQPIPQASRLLLTLASKSTNTGFAWEEDQHTVANWGTGPSLVEPVVGQLTLSKLTPESTYKLVPATPLAQPIETSSSEHQLLQVNGEGELLLDLSPQPYLTYLFIKQ
jgi:hypothetical protein